MTSNDIKTIMRRQGKADALELAKRASGLDGTAIIAEESKVPLFVWGTDYSGCPVGAPIGEIINGELQVYKWITPVNTAHYPGMLPSNTPSLLSICHTTDPTKAKPYLAPNGTSGMYMTDEVCTKDGYIWRSKKDNNPYPPGEVGTDDYWEIV